MPQPVRDHTTRSQRSTQPARARSRTLPLTTPRKVAPRKRQRTEQGQTQRCQKRQQWTVEAILDAEAFISQLSRRQRSDLQRWRNRLFAHRDRLAEGCALGSCAFYTLYKTRLRANGTRGHDYNRDHAIRPEVWHLAGTKLKQRWTRAEYFTVVESAKKTGVHLHVVVRDAPGLTAEWIEQAINTRYPDFEVHGEKVWNGYRLARYLTKIVNDPQYWAGLHYFHITSASRGWLPKVDAEP